MQDYQFTVAATHSPLAISTLSAAEEVQLILSSFPLLVLGFLGLFGVIFSVFKSKFDRIHLYLLSSLIAALLSGFVEILCALELDMPIVARIFNGSLLSFMFFFRALYLVELEIKRNEVQKSWIRKAGVSWTGLILVLNLVGRIGVIENNDVFLPVLTLANVVELILFFGLFFNSIIRFTVSRSLTISQVSTLVGILLLATIDIVSFEVIRFSDTPLGRFVILVAQFIFFTDSMIHSELRSDKSFEGIAPQRSRQSISIDRQDKTIPVVDTPPIEPTMRRKRPSIPTLIFDQHRLSLDLDSPTDQLPPSKPKHLRNIITTSFQSVQTPPSPIFQFPELTTEEISTSRMTRMHSAIEIRGLDRNSRYASIYLHQNGINNGNQLLSPTSLAALESPAQDQESFIDPSYFPASRSTGMSSLSNPIQEISLFPLPPISPINSRYHSIHDTSNCYISNGIEFEMEIAEPRIPIFERGSSIFEFNPPVRPSAQFATRTITSLSPNPSPVRIRPSRSTSLPPNMAIKSLGGHSAESESSGRGNGSDRSG